jgi:hypothetical protein
VASVRAEGYPNFDIKPPGRREQYAVLTYLEPAAMLEERLGSISPPIRWWRKCWRPRATAGRWPPPASRSWQATDAALRPGRAAAGLSPQYAAGHVAERRAAYLGSVGAGFSIPRLVQGAIDEMTVRQVHLTLYADGSADVEQRRLVIEPTDRLLFNDTGAMEATPLAAAELDEYFETCCRSISTAACGKRSSRCERGAADRFRPVLPVDRRADRLCRHAAVVQLCVRAVCVAPARHQAGLLLDTVLNNVDAHVYMKDQSAASST